MSDSILVVDDREEARFIRRKMLERGGYAVTESSTAVEAYETAVAVPLRLVLLDVQLPDGDGWSLCRRMKGARPSLPVVMVSAIHRSETARAAACESGADGLLVDPVSSARLLDAVALALGESAPNTVARAHVWTDPAGFIVSIDDTAAILLNTTARAARGRELVLNFENDRAAVLGAIGRAHHGEVVQGEARFRGRERRPRIVGYEIAPDPHGTELLWTFHVREPLTPAS